MGKWMWEGDGEMGGLRRRETGTEDDVGMVSRRGGAAVRQRPGVRAAVGEGGDGRGWEG